MAFQVGQVASTFPACRRTVWPTRYARRAIRCHYSITAHRHRFRFFTRKMFSNERRARASERVEAKSEIFLPRIARPVVSDPRHSRRRRSFRSPPTKKNDAKTKKTMSLTSLTSLPAVILVRVFEYHVPPAAVRSRPLLRDVDVWHWLVVPWLRTLVPWLKPVSSGALEAAHAPDVMRPDVMRLAVLVRADLERTGDIERSYVEITETLDNDDVDDATKDAALERLKEAAARSCRAMRKAANLAAGDLVAVMNRSNELRAQHVLAVDLNVVPDASTCRSLFRLYGLRTAQRAASGYRLAARRGPVDAIAPHLLRAVGNGLHHPLLVEILFRTVPPESLLCVAAASPRPDTLRAVLDTLRTRLPLSEGRVRLRSTVLMRLLACGVGVYVATFNFLFEFRHLTSHCSWFEMAPYCASGDAPAVRAASGHETKLVVAGDDDTRSEKKPDVSDDHRTDQETKRTAGSGGRHSRSARPAIERARREAVRAEHARWGIAPTRTHDPWLDNEGMYKFLCALEARRYRRQPAPTDMSAESGGSSSTNGGGSADDDDVLSVRRHRVSFLYEAPGHCIFKRGDSASRVAAGLTSGDTARDTPTQRDRERDAGIVEYLLRYQTGNIDVDTLLIMWRLEPDVVASVLRNPRVLDRLQMRSSGDVRRSCPQHPVLRLKCDGDGAFFANEGAPLSLEARLAYLHSQLTMCLPGHRDVGKYGVAKERLTPKRVAGLVAAIDPNLESFPCFQSGREFPGTVGPRPLARVAMCLYTLECLLDYGSSRGLLPNMAKQMCAAREGGLFELVAYWLHDAHRMAALVDRYPAFAAEICGRPGVVDIRKSGERGSPHDSAHESSEDDGSVESVEDDGDE